MGGSYPRLARDQTGSACAALNHACKQSLDANPALDPALLLGAVALAQDAFDLVERLPGSKLARIGKDDLENARGDVAGRARLIRVEEDFRLEAVAGRLEVGLLERLAVQAGVGGPVELLGGNRLDQG